MSVDNKLKLNLRLTKHYAMKTYRGVDVQIHSFLSLTLARGEWSV
jgi:hypothetical protein